jgi:hypothetical protein
MFNTAFIAKLLLVISTAAAGAEGPRTNILDVAIRRAVSFGESSDQVTVEEIDPAWQQITVVMQPMGETCAFRLRVAPGESLQFRIGGTALLLCRLTLLPLQSGSKVEFSIGCDDREPASEIKCPPDH